MASIEEIIERESADMGRPCRLVHSHYTEREGHTFWFVVYDASGERQRQIRWAVYIDDAPRASGIVEATSNLPAILAEQEAATAQEP